MALLDAIGSILQTAGVGTLATNLFLSQMPDSPDACVVVLENQGGSPQYTFGSSVTQVDRPRIRVVARASADDYVSAKTKIEAVRSSLGAVRDESLESVVIMCVLDTTGSYPLSFDGEDRPLLGCDFAVWLDA
jgi:hypothetical protein